MGSWDSRFALANSTQMILLSWLTPQRTFRQVRMQCQHGDSDTGSRSELGHPKSAAMIFKPRRNLPACNVTLGGIALLVVSEFKYLGVVLSPTLSWADVQHVVNRGNRLLAWYRAGRLPLHMASSIFLVRLAQHCLGRNSLPHHPLPSRVWIVRCGSGFGSCWVGPLVRPMLVFWLNLDGQTQNGSLQVAFCHYLAVTPP